MSDEIEKWHRMWGEDGDDKKGRRDDDDGETAALAVPSFSYAGIEPLAMRFADQPQTRPIQWAQVKQVYGVIPYENPRHEYILSTHRLNQATLEYRWQGMGYERDILLMFFDDSLEIERQKSQQVRKRRMAEVDHLDDVDIKINNNAQIQFILNRIDTIQQQLERRVEISVEYSYSPFEGGRYEEHERPLSIKAQARLEKEIREYIQQYRVMTGQSTQNIHKKETHEIGENYAEVLSKTLREMNHRTPSGYTLAELEKIERGEALEGEVVPNPEDET